MKQGIMFKIMHVLPLCMTMLMHGVCVVDSMNIWQLAAQMRKKIGSATEVNQSNFSTVITGPGYYRVCEALDGTIGGGIAINFDDVILDLGGYATDNFVISIDANNVLVSNGTMRNAPFFIDISSTSQNIVVEDLLLDTVLNTTPPHFAIRVSSSTSASNITIRNVTILNGAPSNILIDGTSNGITSVTLENIKMLGTNSAFTSGDVSTVGGAIVLTLCTDVVLKNIDIVDQISEANGIRMVECSNIQTDGVRISTSQVAPDVGFTPVAYRVIDSVTGIHKNITIDGGASTVYTQGIFSSFSDPNSEPTIYDTYFVTNINGDGATHTFLDNVSNATVSQCVGRGFQSGGSAIFNNCNASSNDVGFATGAADVVINSIAEGNANEGFLVEGGLANFVDTQALFNGADGFEIILGSDGCSFDHCTANRNSTALAGVGGFTVLAGNCNFDYCTSNYNSSHGFFVFGDTINFNYCTALSSSGSGFFINDTSSNCNFNCCTSNTNGISGYAVDGLAHKFYACEANGNTCPGAADAGFSVTANSCTFTECTAMGNSGSILVGSVNAGFLIVADACALDKCVASEDINGFVINVPSTAGGCFVTNCVANDNLFSGFAVLGIGAEANAAGGFPQDGTWSIGLFTISNPATTTNRGVRIANCIALRNLFCSFCMSGTVYQRGAPGTNAPFVTTIFPPIGIVIDVYGSTVNNPRPLNSVGVFSIAGTTTVVTNKYLVSFGCNYGDNNPGAVTPYNFPLAP